MANCRRRGEIFIWIICCSIVVMCSTVYAQDAARFKAPVRCEDKRIAASCGYDISLRQAQNSYADKLTLLSSVEATTTIGVPLLDRNLCNSRETGDPYYFWAPAVRLEDGLNAYAKILYKAQNGAVSEGRLYVETLESNDFERHYAFCEVKTAGNAVGPPRACTTVAVVTPTQILLRAGLQGSCYLSTSYRPSGAIQIDFSVDTKVGIARVAGSIAQVLLDDLKLEVRERIDPNPSRRDDHIVISSVAGLRDSLILESGWREALDVDLSIDRLESGLRVSAIAHALVSRQAVGSLTSYSGLDDAQRASYAAAINLIMEKGIRLVCNKYRKLDANRLQCYD